MALTTAALTAASIGVAAGSSAMSASNSNKQTAYQQAVLQQNKIAAKNKAAAEAKARRTEATRAQAKTSAQMGAKGIGVSSGTFMDLIGQGAAAGEMDVLKAKYEGDAQAWALNNEINALESTKKNVGLEAGMAGLGAGLSAAESQGIGVGNNTKGKLKLLDSLKGKLKLLDSLKGNDLDIKGGNKLT